MRDRSALDRRPRELIEDLGVSVGDASSDGRPEKIRLLAEQVQTASEPRAVVAGGIESWYVGPTRGPELAGAGQHAPCRGVG